jgi:short-subunit dehydrogenase
MASIAGSSILVIGASGGLGSEIARILAAEGADLVLSGRSEHRLASLGIPGAVIAADLTSPAAIRQLVASAVETLGSLDGVVIAAGVVAFGPSAEASDETLDALFTLNVLAPIRVIQAAQPALVSSAAAGRSPFIVTISGVVAESPTAGLAAYSASKAALAAFDQAAGRELRRAGIRLLDARPGHTETALSTHPIEGTAPKFPAGLSPTAVARRIVDAIIDDERDLPSGAFG